MSSWQHLSVAGFKALNQQGTVQVVDIRDTASYHAGHIPGAQPLNDGTLEQFLSMADKTEALVVCCYHGHSSQNAAEFLVQQDFKNVYSLDGGYTAWAGEQ